MSDQDPAEASKRREDARRRLFPSAPDPEDPRMLRWESMPQNARAAACLTALLQRWPIAREDARYDAETKVVYVVRPDPNVRGASRVSSRPAPETAEESLAQIRAAFGYKADEVARLVRARW